MDRKGDLSPNIEAFLQEASQGLPGPMTDSQKPATISFRDIDRATQLWLISWSVVGLGVVGFVAGEILQIPELTSVGVYSSVAGLLGIVSTSI